MARELLLDFTFSNIAEFFQQNFLWLRLLGWGVFPPQKYPPLSMALAEPPGFHLNVLSEQIRHKKIKLQVRTVSSKWVKHLGIQALPKPVLPRRQAMYPARISASSSGKQE